MKKWISLLLAGIILIQALSLVGCSKTLITADSLIYEIIPADTEGGIPTITLPEFDSDDVDSYMAPLEEIIRAEMARTSYTELLEQQLEHLNNLDALYLSQIVRALSPDESKELVGYGMDVDFTSTFYEARLIYDYLSEMQLNEVFYLRVSASHHSQFAGNPPLEPGDAMLSFLGGPRAAEGSKIYRAVVVAFMVAPDSITVDSKTAIYKFGNNDAEFKVMEQPMSSSEKSMVRAYAENPAKFSQKLLLGDFVEFVKRDFKERGIVVQDKDK